MKTGTSNMGLDARAAAAQYLIEQLEHNDFIDVHEYVIEELYDHNLDPRKVHDQVDHLSWMLRYYLKEIY